MTGTIFDVLPDLPDPDWYLDHVVVPSGIEHSAVGPIRTRQSVWSAAQAALAAQSDELVDLALRHGFVLTRQQVRAAGMPDAELRRLVRRRLWTGSWRGVLSVLPPQPLVAGNPGATGSAAGAYGDAPQVIAAAAALAHPGSTVSHRSAALLHGLPVIGQAPRPTLTLNQPDRTCGRAGVRVHAASLSAGDIQTWFGAPVTSVGRTVIDIARTVGVGAALVAADGALHEGLLTRAALVASVDAARGWPGVRRARFVAYFADGLAESPLESLTRLCLHEGGLPPPELQVPIVAGGRRFRVDLAWRRRRAVVEADGRLKYTGDRLWQEKRRQELIERAGYRVVRVTWNDVVNDSAATVARVRFALGLSSGPL
ncbi:MAG: type IV toxin-antitoxin system AbiEi family antitoxin domain-containing protein [Jatrophihabitantaceae bacterium]